MIIEGINWDEVPETLSLEQLYQLIHVSKRVAKSLVENEILKQKAAIEPYH